MVFFSQSLLKPFNNSWQGPLLARERSINGGLKRCPTILLRRPRPRLLLQHGNGRKNVESAAIFFLRVEFCEEIIHPPRFVVVFCTKAPGPGGYSVCVHERDYLWDCFSDMVYRFYSHLFVPTTLPLVLSKVSRSGILEEKRLPRWAISPKRDLCSLLHV